MKRKLLFSLVVLVCFAWSLTLADTAPGRTDITEIGSDDSKITAEMEKDRIERERLAAKDAANEVSDVIQAKKEELLLEQQNKDETEKTLELLNREATIAEDESRKSSEQFEIINLDQYELDKTRLLKLEAREYLSASEAIEYKTLYQKLFPPSPVSRPDGGGMILVEGDDCTDPIVVELDVVGLPFVDAGQTNCGRLDDYFDTCLGNYDGGEDIIYEIVVGTAGDYEITMDPLGTTWTGLLIDDTCPPGGTGECIDYDTGSSGVRSLAVSLAAGTYYIMVDTWASPDCIPAFDLTIDTYVPPTGRCCYNDYADCADGITETECLTYAGNPEWNEGLNCTDHPCATIPSNDECADATPVDVPSSTYGSTIFANSDTAPYCGTSDGTGGGVWYSVVGTGNTMTVSVCDEITDYDTKIRVYCNSCDDLMCAAGNDDDFNCTYNTLQSTVEWCSEEGTEYFILVHGFSSNVGYFMLDISDDGVPCDTPPSCVPPVGRCCYNYFADCTESTEGECLAQPGAPQWTEGLTCGGDPCVVPPSGRCCYDYLASCGDMIELECLDQAGAPLWDEGLTCFGDPCPIPPPGDFCNDPLIIEESFPYSTGGNTCEYNNFCDISGSDNSEVIYQLEITSAVDLTVSLCGSTYDTKLAIYLDDCCTGDDSHWAYNDDSCGLQSEITAYFTPGVYYLVVDGYSSNCGDYVLNIDLYYPPVGRCCYNDYGDCDDMTEGECLIQPGNPIWIEGLNCDDNPCPIPPENDDCTTAIALTDPVPIIVTGSTELGVNDYGPFAEEPACWQGTWFTTSGGAADVVYTWVVPSDGLYRISLCGSTYDTVLLLYNNVCPPIYPDDFICGNDDFCGLQSELILDLTADQDLMIVVDGYSSSAGDFILTIEEIVGACCVDEVCVGTLPEVDCLAQEGAWFDGETCPEFNCELDCLTQIPNQVNGIFSDLDCGICDTGLQLLAENFIMASETDVLSLVFWGGYFPDNIVMENDDFYIIFREDNAGVPGAEITAITNVSADDRFDTGIDLFGVDEYQYTIDISGYGVHLLPGTYFVEIFNNSVENADSWFWETGDLDPLVGILGQAWTTTAPEEPWNYDAVTDMALDIVCEGGGGGSCGSYVIGDYNGSESFNVADIIAAFSKLKIGTPEADLLCDCEGNGNEWAVAMDVNNSCGFNIADVIWGFGKLKGQPNVLEPCDLCPPDGSPRPGGDQPLIVPNLESKAKLSTGSGME